MGVFSSLLAALLGFCLGTLVNGLADYIRCHSIGFEFSRQATTCVRWSWRDWLSHPFRAIKDSSIPWREQASIFLPACILALAFAVIWGRENEGIFFLRLVESVWQTGLLLFAVTDLKWRILPIEAMATLGVIVAGLKILFGSLTFVGSIEGALFAALFFGIQVWISRGRWLGAGDPWMGAMIGLVLGWPMIGVSIYFTYLFGIFVIAWAFGRSSTIHRLRYPFGPLLVLGALAAHWFGEGVLLFLR